MLDLGVYPVSLASMILRPPAQIRTAADLGPTGVDLQAAMILYYQNGAAATLYRRIKNHLKPTFY